MQSEVSLSLLLPIFLSNNAQSVRFTATSHRQTNKQILIQRDIKHTQEEFNSRKDNLSSLPPQTCQSILYFQKKNAKQKVRQQKQTVVTNKNTTPRPANNHINLKHLKVQSKKKPNSHYMTYPSCEKKHTKCCQNARAAQFLKYTHTLTNWLNSRSSSNKLTTRSLFFTYFWVIFTQILSKSSVGTRKLSINHFG